MQTTETGHSRTSKRFPNLKFWKVIKRKSNQQFPNGSLNKSESIFLSSYFKWAVGFCFIVVLFIFLSYYLPIFNTNFTRKYVDDKYVSFNNNDNVLNKLDNKTTNDIITPKKVKENDNILLEIKLPTTTTTTKPTITIKNDKVSDFGGSKFTSSKAFTTISSTTESYHSFTSVLQNSHGIPQEEVRLTKLTKIKYGRGNINFYTTTDNNIFNPKVSPTLPSWPKVEKSTVKNEINSTDDGFCESTSLPLCRGLLRYDLTNTMNRKRVTNIEYQHFQHLVNSKCSLRVDEFICGILEPECRPRMIGNLRPCKRICKGIYFFCCNYFQFTKNLEPIFLKQFWNHAHT